MVKFEGKLTQSVPCERGIMEGDSPGPLIFNIILNEILKKSQRETICNKPNGVAG